MSCTKPLLAYKAGINKETGKSLLHWVPYRVQEQYDLRQIEEMYGVDNLVRIPCGKCPACILTYRKNWSVRCRFESLCHLQNCFITLTYDDEHYKKDCADRSEDFTDFIKCLRNRGIMVRYFACGEVGKEGRFHYHAILFGYFPSDAKVEGKKNGVFYYSSEFLSKIWFRGFILLEEYNDATAEYVAGYVSKKSDLDKQGLLMFSRRPGLGYNWFINHKEDMLKYGVLIGKNGTISFLPKYASNLIVDTEEYEIQKADKINKMRLKENSRLHSMKSNHSEDILKADSYKYKDKLEKRRRML